MTSTAKLAADAVANFMAWTEERDRAGDWIDYIRGGKINRSEVAKECGFGRAAWGQNPALTTTLAMIERRLAESGILDANFLEGAQPDNPRAELGAAEERARRALSARASLEKRVKALEEQNAILRAANRDLTERLRRSAFAEQHLAETGRILPP
jgi:hypothetical protein